jgi:hypothetical protein
MHWGGSPTDASHRRSLQDARASVGQDFAGEVCTGTPLQIETSEGAESRAEESQHRPGPQNNLVANELKIQLDLQLTRTVPTLSVGGGE